MDVGLKVTSMRGPKDRLQRCKIPENIFGDDTRAQKRQHSLEVCGFSGL